MKKVEMIKTIQLAEAKAWLELKESQVKNGKLNSTTRDLKEKWMTLKCLMGSLDIESDVELEESKLALGIMLDNFRSTVF
jgi:hypothetical protein